MHSRPLLRTRWPSWTATATRPHPRSFSASIHVTDTVRVEEADRVKLRRPLGEVFEEPSADYDGTHFPPAPPSILHQIQQLPLVLPAHVDGASIFEDESEEYQQTPGDAYPSNYSAATLESLVNERRYGTAYSLLCEMQHVNTPIPPSYVYERAAFYTLRSRTLSPEEKLLQFTQWFSLIPPILISSWRNFAELRYHFLQAPSAYIPMLERTVLILASKGYAQATRPFLAPLFTYLPLRHHRSLIANIEFRDAEYWSTHLPSEAPLCIQQTLETVRGTAVRCLIYNNHIDEALSFFLGANAPKFGLPVEIIDVVLHKLDTTPIKRFKTHIPAIQALRDARLAFDLSPSTSSSTLPRTPSAPSTPSYSSLHSLPMPPPRHSLAQTLRYLRTHLSNHDPHRKLPTLLTQFFTDYITHTHGRTTSIRQLLSFALRRGSQKQVKNIVFAEMRVYRMLGRPEMVIRAFVEHFYLSGVPEDDVMKCYQWVLHQGHMKGKEKEVVGTSGSGRKKRTETREVGDIRRIAGYETDRPLPRGKLWPDLEQSALVWEALILQIANADRKRRDKAMSILKLYEKFLKIGREETQPSSSSSSSDDISDVSENVNNTNTTNYTDSTISPASTPTRFTRPISSPAFHTFMYYLIPLLGPAIGHLIIHDMKSLSLHPSIYHYTTLARGWAEFSTCGDGGGHGKALAAIQARGWSRSRTVDRDARELEAARVNVDAGVGSGVEDKGSVWRRETQRREAERREMEGIVWTIVDALEKGEEPVVDAERIRAGVGESWIVGKVRQVSRHVSTLEVLDSSRLGGASPATADTTTAASDIDNSSADTDTDAATVDTTIPMSAAADMEPIYSPVPVPKLDRAFYIAIIQGFLYASNDDAAEEAIRRLVVRFERKNAPSSSTQARNETEESSPGISSLSPSMTEDWTWDSEEVQEDQMGTLEELAVYPPLIRAARKLRDLRAMKQKKWKGVRS